MFSFQDQCFYIPRFLKKSTLKMVMYSKKDVFKKKLFQL